MVQSNGTTICWTLVANKITWVAGIVQMLSKCTCLDLSVYIGTVIICLVSKSLKLMILESMYLKKESPSIADINIDIEQQKRIQEDVQFEQLLKVMVTFYVENYCSIRRGSNAGRIQRKTTIFARLGDGILIDKKCSDAEHC